MKAAEINRCGVSSSSLLGVSPVFAASSCTCQSEAGNVFPLVVNFFLSFTRTKPVKYSQICTQTVHEKIDKIERKKKEGEKKVVSRTDKLA